MNTKIARVEWKCPKCGMSSAGCKTGTAQRQECRSVGIYTHCSGFICECTEHGSDDQDHGYTYGKPCHEAYCHHCGWGGTFPTPPRKPKDWEKKALAAGWQPPKGWPSA